MKVKTAVKTAGLSFAGYALASIFADKLPLNPAVTQVAGFVGAFLGTLVAPWREQHRERTDGNGAAPPPSPVQGPQPEGEQRRSAGAARGGA